MLRLFLAWVPSLIALLFSSGKSEAITDFSCPSAQPDSGQACDQTAQPVACEYGGDRFGRDTTLALCLAPAPGSDTSWQLQPEDVPANPPGCPATWADAQALIGTSGADRLECDYDEGRCAFICYDTMRVWRCRERGDIPSAVARQPQPPVLPSCGEERPLLGSPCATEDQVCYYAQFCNLAPLSFGPAMKCQHGVWNFQPATVACKLVRCASS